MKPRIRLAGSVAVFALMQAWQIAPATAQTVPAPVSAPTGTDTTKSTKGEEITVTGTRIKTTNANSDAPIDVISAAEIGRTSAQTLEDVLTKLPEIGSNGVYASTNNGGDGSSCIDLRNLGYERTLVLVDGKRFVHTGGGVDCVDLNNIPLALVDRIEILKDGASSTYGADAVAGVINIILKHNFTGVTFKADGSIATTAGDDQTGDISVTAGTTFDKGNFVISGEYLNRGPVYQANRSYGLNPVQSNAPLGSGPPETGSFYTPNGIVTGDTNTTNVDVYNTLGELNKAGTAYTNYTGANSQRYDFGADQVLSGSIEKESLTSLGSYKFNDYVEGFIEEFYTHKQTGQQLAPQPVAGAVGTIANLPDAYVVPEGNPYLTALLGPNSGPVDLYKRMTQFGDRQYNQYSDTFQFNGGFKGTVLDSNWDYEVFFQYGLSDNRLETLNSINFERLEQEVGFQAATATAAEMADTASGGFDSSTFGIYNPAVCIAASGCVLSNPFGQNMSAAAIAYAKFTQVDTAQDSLKVWGGTLTNSELYELPAGPLGLSLGVEHRSEAGEFSPDALVQTGVTETAPAQPTKGGFSVTEVFGETLIPVLKDLPGAKDLHFNVGGRFFDYNTFGTGETWKVNGVYVPVTGIKIRASDGTAFRQPSITDLFEGQSISYVGASDPCDQFAFKTYTAAQQVNIKANCLKQGVNPATFTQIGSQIQTIVGGNPNLQPETARTQTLGVVLNPPFIPHFALTFDYYRTKISNNIGSVVTSDIVNGCYESTNLTSPFCALINPRLGTGQLSTVTATNQNLGVERTEGLDIGGNYTYATQSYGAFSLENDLTYVFKFQNQNLPGGPFIGDLNTIGTSLYSTGYPRIRDNASVDWRYNDFQFGWRLRYIDGMYFYPLLTPSQVSSYRTPGIFYNDLVASYDWRNWSFNVGADNIFNKQPPYVNDTTTNTDPSVYDILGRVVYLKLTARF